MTPLLGDPASFVISLNLKRRQLTESQRAMIALKAKPLLEKEARRRMLAGKTLPPVGGRVGRGESAAFAGEAVGVSQQTVNRAQAAAAVNVSARSVENKSCAPAAAGATSGTPEPPTPPRPAAGKVRYEDAAPR